MLTTTELLLIIAAIVFIVALTGNTHTYALPGAHQCIVDFSSAPASHILSCLFAA